MFPRCKKGRKSMLQDIDNNTCEENSLYRNPPRNVLAALDERITQLERGGRTRKKRKGEASLNTCSSQRPNSVPSKTVSFSPHNSCRGDNEFACERKDPQWKNKCSYCETRDQSLTSPRRKKMSADKGHNAESTGSPSSDYGSPEYYTDVCSSPGPAKFITDCNHCSTDYKRPWVLSTARARSEERVPAYTSTYYTSGLGRDYSYMHPTRTLGRHALGCMYTPTNKRDHCFGFGGSPGTCMPNSHPWKSDMSVDLLLAKYSEFSHAKTLSAPTSYIPYKSSFLGTGKPVGNLSNNTLPCTLLTSKSNAPFTAQRIQGNAFSVPPIWSRYTEGITNPLGRSQSSYYDFNKSFNCSYDHNLYQPRKTTSFINEPLPFKKSSVPRKFIFSPVSAFPRSVSEHKPEMTSDTWINPWLQNNTSTSRYSSTPPRASFSFNNRAVRSADHTSNAQFEGGHCSLYGKTANLTPTETNSGIRTGFYISGSPFRGDMSKYCGMDTALSKTYLQPSTRDSRCEYTNNKPVRCCSITEIPKFKKYPGNESCKTFSNSYCYSLS